MGDVVTGKRAGIALLLAFLVACGGGGGAPTDGDPSDDTPGGSGPEVAFKGVQSVDGDLGADEVTSIDAMVHFTTALAEATLPDGIAGFLDSDPGSSTAPHVPSKPGLVNCPTVTTPQVRVRNVDFSDCGTAFEGNVSVAWSLLDSNFTLVFQPDFEIAGVNVTGTVTRERVGAVGEGKGEHEIPATSPIGLVLVPAGGPIGIVSPPATVVAPMLEGPLGALRAEVGGSVGAREVVLYGAAGVTVDAAEVVVQVGGPDGPDADDVPDQPLHWTDDGCICPDGGILQVDVAFAVDEVAWVYTIDGEDVTVLCTLDPAIALGGTLVVEFGVPAACGGYTATYTPDPTEVTVSEADVLACVEPSGLTAAQKTALAAYFAATAATDVSIDVAAIRTEVVEGVRRALAARLPGGLCQPELLE